MTNQITTIMKCPRCEGKLYVQHAHTFLWLQCRTCGKKTKALQKDDQMWED